MSIQNPKFLGFCIIKQIERGVFMYNSQEIAKKIKDIAKQQKKSTGKILEQCGLSKNALSSMNSGFMLQLENLVKIADCLEVSVDTLLGREETEKSTNAYIIENRDAIVDKINSLSEKQLDKLLGYIDALNDK